MDIFSALMAGSLFALACNLDTVLAAVGQGARGIPLGPRELFTAAGAALGLLLLLPCVLLTGLENIHKHSFYGLGRVAPPAFTEILEQLIRTGAVLGLLWYFLPQNPERTVGLIVWAI